MPQKIKSGISDIKTGICVYDLHHPYHNRKLWENILRVIGDINPDFFVFGGDQLDMDALNHHEKEKDNRRFMEGKRIKSMYDNFQNDVLNDLNLSLPDTCRKIMLLANHENWGEQFVDKNPELEGMVEVEKYLKLEENGWEVIKYKNYAKIGKLYFTHGDIIRGGKFKSDKMVNISERNVIFGHFHTLECFVKVNSFDCEPHMAMCMPCACDLNPQYMKDKPSSWVNGFGLFYIHPNDNFNIYPVISSKDHFVLNEKYY